MDQLLDIAANSDQPVPEVFSDEEGLNDAAPSGFSSLTREDEEARASALQYDAQRFAQNTMRYHEVSVMLAQGTRLNHARTSTIRQTDSIDTTELRSRSVQF
jgi:hypothetical protein